VDHALTARVNPWLLVALVAALILLASAVLITTQPGLLHMIGGMLQSPSHGGLACGGTAAPC
jgi:hypothetical protein